MTLGPRAARRAQGRFPTRLICYGTTYRHHPHEPHQGRVPLHCAYGRRFARRRSHATRSGRLGQRARHANLLEWARKNHPRQSCSTSARMTIRARARWRGVPLTLALRAGEHVCATKAGGELLCLAYVHQHCMPIAVTRCCTYSASSRRREIHPACHGRIQRGEHFRIHARGGAISSRLYIRSMTCRAPCSPCSRKARHPRRPVRKVQHSR